MISLKIIRHTVIVISVILFTNSPLVGGEKEKGKTIKGKVVEYKPKDKIVIETASAGKKEVKISKDTILTSTVTTGSSVKIELNKTDTSIATKIKVTSDVAGPVYGPPPPPK